MAVFYPYVLSMTDEDPQEWAAEGCVPPPNFVLPADALLISGRLGDQYQFIRCTGEDDSPVWYFNTYQWEVVESHPSILSWLESWCSEAEQSIVSGYFDRHPNGTRP
jgi:hypothetical protein